MIKYYKSKTGEILETKLIKSNDDINKEKTSYFINLLKENSGIIDTNNIKSIFNSFKNENAENISSKKFLTSNLFLINNNIIPKIWTLLFSFDYSEVLNYIIHNGYRKMLKIVRKFK